MMSNVKITIQIAVIPTLGSYGGNDKTKYSGSGEVGIAPGLGPGDRGFESRLPDKYGRLTASYINKCVIGSSPIWCLSPVA